MGGWRLHWLTRPVPRDPEPGERSDAMTGACLTVSQVQSIPWSAAPSSTSLLLVTSAFVTPIVTREVAAKPSAMRAAAVLEAPVSFLEKETGAGWRRRNGQADRMLLGRRVGWLPQGQRYLVGIHHMGSDRTSYRTRIVLGGEPPRLRRDLSGFWPHSAASAALASPGLLLWTMFVKLSDFRGLAPVDKTIPRWTSVVFHRRNLCQQFFS